VVRVVREPAAQLTMIRLRLNSLICLRLGDGLVASRWLSLLLQHRLLPLRDEASLLLVCLGFHPCIDFSF
jgi:hypothetical protein